MTQKLAAFIVLACALISQRVTTPVSRVRHYHFIVEYFSFDSKGEFQQKQRIAADYTAGEPADDVRWTRVMMARGATLRGGYGREIPLAYMEGLTYSPASELLRTPEFFRTFPADAVEARNLVWDAYMLETFTFELRKVKVESPYRVPTWSLPLGGTGAFSQADTFLTWIGLVERHRKECALIRYESFFNSIDAGAKPGGRRDYWGDIWVSLATSDIESATLQEESVGASSVVRRGTLERLPD
jgi:hypothetical protein